MPNYRFRFSQHSADSRIRAKVFGIGSAGCNIVEGASVPTIAFSTSEADLSRSTAERKFLMSPERLAGLSGPEAAIMKLLPAVAGHEMLDLFNNTDMAFLMSGLGGATGSLGSKVFSLVSRAKNVPSIALVTYPFSAESIRRREMAERCLGTLIKSSDLCLVFDNDKLSSLAPNLQLSRAFGILNRIMIRPVRDMCSTICRSDLRTFAQAVDGSGYSRFGLGLARGDERVDKVVAEAFSSPWFDYDVKGTTAAIAIYSAADPWDREAEGIITRVEEGVPSSKLLWGSYPDPSLGERIRLSLVLCRGR
jgi:cell division protein FtsZ